MSKSPETSPTGQPLIMAQVVAPPEPRWLILVMLFVLMGALAIPILWRSEHFSRRAKIILSVLAVIQTAVVLVILALVIGWFAGQISDAMARQ